MRLSISNIAWDVCEDHKVLEILEAFEVSAIDIAPGKYFSLLNPPSLEELKKVRSFWSERGIDIVGMQSLLFGTQGLNVFKLGAQQRDLLTHLEKIFIIAHELNSRKIVFGSPKNRDRSGLSDELAEKIAMDFFFKVGDIASKYGVLFCLEPNPKIYGCNFLTTTTEAYSFVSKLNHPSVMLQFDSGTVFQNDENVEDFFEFTNRFGHFHISEPNLKVIGRNYDHSLISDLLNNHLKPDVVTIEMLTSHGPSRLQEIEEAIDFAKRTYNV